MSVISQKKMNGCIAVGLAFWLAAVLTSCSRTPEQADPTVTPNETLERVRRVVSKQLNVELDRVNPQATMRDVGADDLDLVEIVMELEDQFEISIPDDAIDKVGSKSWDDVTVGQLAEIVDGRQSAQEKSVAPTSK